MSDTTYERKCPKCGAPMVKNGGCNTVTCTCDCNYCYYCGEGFETREAATKHAQTEKHLFELPPDLAKRQGKEVNGAELKEFYEKYPKLKYL